MKLRAWMRAGVVVAVAALLACGSTTNGGGGSVVAHDVGAAGDVQTADAAAADVALTDDVADDAAQDIAQDVKVPVTMVGGQVDPPLAPIAKFTKVVDSTGAKMTPDALQGHWTVLWFYPAASTAG